MFSNLTTPSFSDVQKPFLCVISHSIQLTPQELSAESRKIAGAEALAVARRPEEASWDKHI